jgi:hypothetical protein
MTKESERDRAINVRIDGLTETEQEKMSSGIKKLKKQIAPKARGTIVEGDMRSLPAQESLSLDSSDSDEYDGDEYDSDSSDSDDDEYDSDLSDSDLSDSDLSDSDSSDSDEYDSDE